MPTNLYGPGDNFHSENSHVIPGLMRRFHEGGLARAPHVTIWGTGTARREFLHVDDLARAVAFTIRLPTDAYTTATQPNVQSGLWARDSSYWVAPSCGGQVSVTLSPW